MRSLINQDFNSFEIIAVDDGSSDSCADKLDNYAQDNRVRVVHKQNGGLPQARKSGLEIAKGKYICFVDGDDWFDSNYLSCLYETITSASADIASCNYLLEFEKTGKSLIGRHASTSIFSADEAMAAFLTRSSVFTYVWNKMFRRDILDNVSFPTAHIIGEDFTIVSQAIAASNTVAHINAFPCHYLQRAGSMTKDGFGERDKLAFENYTRVGDHLKISYPKYTSMIDDFLIQDKDMGLLFPMARSTTRNYEMIHAAQKDVRNGLWHYLAHSPDEIVWKGAALLLSMSPQLFFWMYKRVKK